MSITWEQVAICVGVLLLIWAKMQISALHSWAHNIGAQLEALCIQFERQQQTIARAVALANSKQDRAVEAKPKSEWEQDREAWDNIQNEMKSLNWTEIGNYLGKKFNLPTTDKWVKQVADCHRDVGPTLALNMVTEFERKKRRTAV